jgi:hypothetical protein
MLDYCSIERAYTGIGVNTTDAVSVAHTTIHDCDYGVRASSGTVSFLNCAIVNNISYGIYLEGATPQFGTNISEWNDIHGNGHGYLGIDLRNGPTDIEAPWIYWGTMDHVQILTHIWDHRSDASLGYVQILPFINAAHDEQMTAVDDPGPGATVPTAFFLQQNAPNPFNPSTDIKFDLPVPAAAQLTVYSLNGKRIATLVDELLPVGQHMTVWYGRDDSGRSVASGIYFYRLTAGGYTETRRMVLLK